MTVWLRVMWDIMNSHLYKNVFICQSGLGRERQRSDGDVNLTDWGKRDGSSWLKTVWNRKPTYRSEALIYAHAHGEEISMYGKALLLLPRSRSAGLRLSLAAAKSFLSRASAANVLQKLLFIQIPSRRVGGFFEDERWLHILHVHEVCMYIKPILSCFLFWKQSDQLHNPATLNVISHLKSITSVLLSLIFMSLHCKTMKQDHGAFIEVLGRN